MTGTVGADAVDVGSEFEAVVGGIVEHEALSGGYPIFAGGRQARFLVAPGGDQLVVVAQVGQGVISAFESGGEGLERSDG